MGYVLSLWVLSHQNCLVEMGSPQSRDLISIWVDSSDFCGLLMIAVGMKIIELSGTFIACDSAPFPGRTFQKTHTYLCSVSLPHSRQESFWQSLHWLPFWWIQWPVPRLYLLSSTAFISHSSPGLFHLIVIHDSNLIFLMPYCVFLLNPFSKSSCFLEPLMSVSPGLWSGVSSLFKLTPKVSPHSLLSLTALPHTPSRARTSALRPPSSLLVYPVGISVFTWQQGECLNPLHLHPWGKTAPCPKPWSPPQLVCSFPRRVFPPTSTSCRSAFRPFPKCLCFSFPPLLTQSPVTGANKTYSYLAPLFLLSFSVHLHMAGRILKM